jgi:chorismate mutase
VPARVRAIRGATTLDHDDRAQLDDRIPELVTAMLARNGVAEDDIVSIVFTSTSEACR